MSKIIHSISVEDVELKILIEGRIDDLKYLYEQFEKTDGDEQRELLKDINEKSESIHELTSIMLENEYKKREQ